MNNLHALDIHKIVPALGESFLCVGSDPYLVDMVLTYLKQKLHESCEPEISYVYGDESKSSTLRDQLDSFSIFSNSRLVILRNAEQLSKPDLEIVAQFLNETNERISLILVADKIDARISSWKHIREHTANIQCDPPKFSGQLSEWLRTELASRNLKMTPNARELFINRVELDFANANNELDKLELRVGDRKQIIEEDIVSSIGQSRVGTIIEFYRAIGKRKTSQALILLQRMMDADWVALQVMFHLVKVFTILYRINLLKQARMSPPEIAKSHLNELFPGQRNEFIEFANHYSLTEVRAALEKLLDTDTKIKTSQASVNTLLTMCVIEITN